MHRIALKCLLALALCLNGFGMPSAMAHSGGPVDGKAPAGSAAPCHEMQQGIGGAASSESMAHRGQQPQGKNDSSCCANGQCFCGCIVSAVLAVPMLPYLTHAAPDHLLPADIADFPLAQSSVLQRPPIA